MSCFPGLWEPTPRWHSFRRGGPAASPGAPRETPVATGGSELKTSAEFWGRRLFQNGLVSPKGCYQCDACDHPPSQTPLHPLAVRAEPGLPNLPFTSGAGRKAGGSEGSCFLRFAGTCLRQTLVIRRKSKLAPSLCPAAPTPSHLHGAVVLAKGVAGRACLEPTITCPCSSGNVGLGS